MWQQQQHQPHLCGRGSVLVLAFSVRRHIVIDVIHRQRLRACGHHPAHISK